MIYYLLATALCISTITFCADPRRDTHQINRIDNMIERFMNSANTTVDRKQQNQEDITDLLAMKNGHYIVRFYQYSLENKNGKISEERINPTTGLQEQRSFATNDVAYVSFDHPNLIADIILKQ